MTRDRLKLAVLACAGLGLAACEGSTISAPESPRFGCGWAQEGGGCDPVDTTKYVLFQGKSVFDYQFYGHPGAGTFDRISGRAYTTAVEGAASVSVTGELRHDKYCDGSYDLLDTKSNTGASSASVGFANQQDPYVGNRFRISGTHTATPATGYVGGGPVYTSVTGVCL